MCSDCLRDLVCAGVQWEIMDVPAPIAAKNAAAARATAEAVRAQIAAKPLAETLDIPTVGTAPTRTATMVVPPIAPMQSVSAETARARAARPTDASSLCRMIAEFGHPLRAGATNVVVPHIAPNPNGLLIITDMPGIDDDVTGNILAGAAGELLDKMLGAIGMSRDMVSISPMLFWRTPGGRTPTEEEMELARPFLDKLLALTAPRVILTLGTMAATRIAGVNLARAHGAVVNRDDATVVVPIYHPNYLMLKPAAKRDVWTALQQVQNLLKTA